MRSRPWWRPVKATKQTQPAAQPTKQALRARHQRLQAAVRAVVAVQAQRQPWPALQR